MSTEIRRSGRRLKFAVHVLLAFMVTELSAQSASPLQPVKTELAPGAADSVTTAPSANAAKQVVPQEMPAATLVTVPVPAPVFVTLSVGPLTVQELPASP